jgi:hypothetical protein
MTTTTIGRHHRVGIVRVAVSKQRRGFIVTQFGGRQIQFQRWQKVQLWRQEVTKDLNCDPDAFAASVSDVGGVGLVGQTAQQPTPHTKTRPDQKTLINAAAAG